MTDKLVTNYEVSYQFIKKFICSENCRTTPVHEFYLVIQLDVMTVKSQ